MKVQYFTDTDTLHLELSTAEPVETKELAENLYVDIDSEGWVVALTVEHAESTGAASDFTYQKIGADSSQPGKDKRAKVA